MKDFTFCLVKGSYSVVIDMNYSVMYCHQTFARTNSGVHVFTIYCGSVGMRQILVQKFLYMECGLCIGYLAGPFY